MAIFANESDGYVQQSVGARLDYGEDWTKFMALIPGDSISSSVWTTHPTGELILENDAKDGAITTVFIRGGVVGTVYRVMNAIETTDGRKDDRYFFLQIADNAEATPGVFKTALFDRFDSVREFKTSSLAFLDDSFPVDKLSDDQIWSRLVSAERDLENRLKVFFEPTKVLPEGFNRRPVEEVVPEGMRHFFEPRYDFDPLGWNSDAWGYTVLNYAPLISLEAAQLAFPSSEHTILDIPVGWMMIDHHYGHLRFVPQGSMMAVANISSFMLSVLNAGRMVPGALRLEYTAGLTNAKTDYPELVTLVRRMAVQEIMKNAFLPTSSSISADGLSQSASYDAEKWQASIDDDVERLRTKFRGIVVGFV